MADWVELRRSLRPRTVQTISATVEITNGKITVTDIAGDNEARGIRGLEAIEDGTHAAQIEAAQGMDIDGVVDATLTPGGVSDAVADALAQAEV